MTPSALLTGQRRPEYPSTWKSSRACRTVSPCCPWTRRSACSPASPRSPRPRHSPPRSGSGELGQAVLEKPVDQVDRQGAVVRQLDEPLARLEAGRLNLG